MGMQPYERNFEIFSVPATARAGAPPEAIKAMLQGVQPESEVTTYKFTSHGQTYVTTGAIHQSNVSAAGVPVGQVALLGMDTKQGAPLGLIMDNIAVEQGSVALNLRITEPIQASTKLSFAVNPSAVLLEEGTTAEMAAGTLNPICVGQCGGGRILAILVANLPTLSAGINAYAAAVRAQLPDAGIDIFNCVLSQCIG